MVVLPYVIKTRRFPGTSFIRNALVERMPLVFLTLFGGFGFLDAVLPKLVRANQGTLTALAAIVSSIASLQIIRPAERLAFSIFVAVRAADSFVASRQQLIRKRLTMVPEWLWRQIPTIVFQMSCFEIIYCWFYHPEALPPTYVRWITKLSLSEPSLIEALRMLKDGRMKYGVDMGPYEAVREYVRRLGLSPEIGDPQYGQIPCFLVHGGRCESCVDFCVFVLRQSFKTAMQLYIPVHLVPALVFKAHRIRSFDAFAKLIVKSGIGAARSSSFLATFIGSIFGTVCLVRNTIDHNDTPLGPTIGSFLCGFSLLLEAPGRRHSLALYCLPKAIESAIIRRLPKHYSDALHGKNSVLQQVLETILFSSGICYIFSSFRNAPESVSPTIRNIMGVFIR